LNCLKKKKLILPSNNSDGEFTDDEILEMIGNKNRQLVNETENALFHKELSEILKTEIGRLSVLYRTLITLYHNEELSYAEIAQITDLPEGTVKNYLFRARKILRENILLTYKKEAL
jgi:RNA polymerase sigma-70 factor (ECF subfamily)